MNGRIRKHRFIFLKLNIVFLFFKVNINILMNHILPPFTLSFLCFLLNFFGCRQKYKGNVHFRISELCVRLGKLKRLISIIKLLLNGGIWYFVIKQNTLSYVKWQVRIHLTFMKMCIYQKKLKNVISTHYLLWLNVRPI